MENQLKRKFGLLMAMCMVVGTVIGSGIFFRNEDIMTYAGGRMWIGVLAWILGGAITLAFAYVMSVLAARHEKVGGLLDYSDALVGERFGYFFGWFMATIFYPSLTGILAWVSARFTVELFGWHTGDAAVSATSSGQTYAIALFYIVVFFCFNALSQKFGSKVQIAGTFLKIIPLIAMGIVGLIFGLRNGVTLENLSFLNPDGIPGVAAAAIFGNSTIGGLPAHTAFFAALSATVFAYIGWDCVMNLNSEIKNSKKNLPIALFIGSIIIMAIYTLYYVGIFGAYNMADLNQAGGSTLLAFRNVFTEAGGTVLFVFIVISCLGTLNGLLTGGQRAFYAIAVRRRGPSPAIMGQVDRETNVANNSGILAVGLVAVWMLIQAANPGSGFGWFTHLNFLNFTEGAAFNFNIANLIPVTFNAFFIPVFIMVMVKQKDLGIFNRFIAPGIAVAGALFLMFTNVYTQRWMSFWYLVVFALIMVGGALVMKKKAAK